ncbi:MAG TPA: DUF2247 family protein [Actinomycetota bacterium]|nr:DUF2247 family protein [Actinomycetota bacterium]
MLLTGPEIGLGFDKGWLRAADAVEIALAKLKVGIPLADAEEQLALLLPQDTDLVAGLAAKLQVSDEPFEERQRVWLYLILDWLLRHQSKVDDPHDVIALLYDDFGFPEEIRGLVKFIPPSPDDLEFTLDELWQRYVERERVRYQQRNEELLQ